MASGQIALWGIFSVQLSPSAASYIESNQIKMLSMRGEFPKHFPWCEKIGG